jgi:hypothetical protein
MRSPRVSTPSPFAVEGGDGCGPVAFVGVTQRHHRDVLGHDRDQTGWPGELAQGVDERLRIVEVHQHPVAQDDVEGLCIESSGGGLTTRLHQAHPRRDLIGFIGQTRVGALEHGGRRINDRHVMTRSGERHALVPGPASDIDHTLALGCQVVAEMLVDHVRANATAQRAIVVIDEPLRERSPRIVGSSIVMQPIVPYTGRRRPDPAVRGRRGLSACRRLGTKVRRCKTWLERLRSHGGVEMVVAGVAVFTGAGTERRRPAGRRGGT